MPDALLWLGVKKIDRFVSMSDMKYDALANVGIEVVTRVDIPEAEDDAMLLMPRCASNAVAHTDRVS